MEWSYPWLSIDGDRIYDDSDFAQFYANLFTDGVSMTTADGLKVTTNPTGGMRVQVSSGAANIEGRSYFNSTALALNIDVASSTQDRVDSVVLRMDKGLRSITLYIKKGSTQVVRTTDIFELQLATISVPRNASNIIAANITDKRADTSVCGYSSPYMNVDVSGLEQQYEDLLAAMYTQFGSDFTTWFDGIKGQLSADAAGNLQNQINELDSQVDQRIDDLSSQVDIKIEGVDSNVIHKTGDEIVEGLKNFQDGIQSGGEDVLTKTQADELYPAKSKGTVLWTGLSTLNSSHTITPSKSLNECQNGWLLVFAPYNGTSAQNFDVTTSFVPKGQTRLTMEQVYNGSIWTVKRYQCTNTTIVGHGSNVGADQIKAALIEVREV